MPRRSRQGGRRRFVVQKHATSHVHYDFRIESLRSWVLPRGFPHKPGERRPAVATEDHPLECPWDTGTCDIIDGNYTKGRLNFYLRGKKLDGEWLIERDPERGETAWSLTKVGTAMKAVPAVAQRRRRRASDTRPQ
jgi:bifunctional non-homologous end joining protein LigD